MKVIGYVRVSTQKQGVSGLGLEGQLEAIHRYAQGEHAEVVAIYREVESGKVATRPELAKAVAHSKRTKAKLVIAKLDRLARNVHFVSGLMESRVDFVACDNPHANRLTIHILAAVAEDEAERISQRTMSALAAARRRGVLLGSDRPGHWDGKEHLRRRGGRKGSEAARLKRLRESEPILRQARAIAQPLRDRGASLRQIAEELNKRDILTSQGRLWHAVQIARILSI